MQRVEEPVFLVSIFNKGEKKEVVEELTKEFLFLVQSANLKIIQSFHQFIEKPDNSSYIGSGKVKEIASHAKSLNVKTLVFNDDLSPAQARNISNVTRCNVVDRTELILDIFAENARTRQAKLQVELAQLEYSFSKLKHLWKHLSRIQGGIGFRGPGERQIEIDRREIRKRISILKKRISAINMTVLEKRKHRSNLVSVSLVGYTNVGKSTLLNLLTSENLYTADKLFATLDATTRSLHLHSGKELVITDTIGFIRNLPPHLITSFHSTLLEVEKADLLVHVVDISYIKPNEQIDAVEKVLQELNVNSKNVLMVFNKCDTLEKTHLSFVKKKWLAIYPHAVFISAKEKLNINSLLERLDEFINKSSFFTELSIPIQMNNLLSFLHNNAQIVEENFDYEKGEKRLRLNIPKQFLQAVVKQIDDFRLLEYIHN
jgi:GTP-binding protein HflX